MPRETLEYDMINQFKETGTFKLPILVVDDEGMEPDKLSHLCKGADAVVTVETDPKKAIATWAEGEHLALITDHRLGTGLYGGPYGHDVIRAIYDTGIVPSGVFVISGFLTEPEIARYKVLYVPSTHIFLKRDPDNFRNLDYFRFGMTVRQETEAAMAADAMMPSQLIYRRSIAPQAPGA